jgi:putative endonuclease
MPSADSQSGTTWIDSSTSKRTNVTTAIAREKQIKAYRRSKKVALIERDNPHWRDLSDQI